MFANLGIFHCMGFTGKWEVLIMGFSMGFNHEHILVEWD